jgi:hypothetical protein
MFLHRDKLGALPSGGSGETILLYVFSPILLVSLYAHWRGFFNWKQDSLEDKSAMYIRAIAAEPVPAPNDPRLKKWDHTKPLFFEEPLHEKIVV